MLGEQEELIFLEKIEEQRWKTGSEIERKDSRKRGANKGRKLREGKEGQVQNVETVVFVPCTEKFE